MPGELWLAMLEDAEFIFTTLERRGCTFLRVLADDVTVIQAYGVSSAQDVMEAARGAAPYYPNVGRLEVFSVRSSPSGAILKRILLLEAEPFPLEPEVQEAVSA